MADQNNEVNSSETLTMKEWELKLGVMFFDYDPEKKLKRSEVTRDMYLGVDHEFRTEWLKRNGYDLTRENYMNAELPAVNAETAEESE